MNKNSIEEDIKIVENYLANSAINEIESNFFKNGGWETVDLEIPKSMQHILSDYKRVLKENEQLSTEVNSLKKENEELNEKILDNAGIYQLGFKDGEESYIKKVKDKIRKNEEIIDISNDGDLIHELYQKNKVYEELLESEE